MIYLFLIQIHEATKHYPNVIMVSFQNQHWILEQEGHNECWIQWHIRVLGTNKQVRLWNVPGREPLQDIKLFHFKDCLHPWNTGKPLSLDAAFCPWTFHRHERFKTYTNRQVSNFVVKWFSLLQLAFRTDVTKTFLTITHISVRVNWQSKITGNQRGDLMSTLRCFPGLMSFVTLHHVNVQAVSHISKDHGSFIHRPRAVQCTVSLDEWFPTFQRIMAPSSTTLKQSNKNSQLAPLRPHKHTTKPVPHPSNWLTTFSHLQFKCYLFPLYQIWQRKNVRMPNTNSQRRNWKH
jgi:hypothetical protein